jgi:hypothetical protein
MEAQKQVYIGIQSILLVERQFASLVTEFD